MKTSLEAKTVFRYASAIFVAHATIDNAIKEGTLAHHTEATRLMLTHPAVKDNDMILPLIMSNIRSLIRLVYVDICNEGGLSLLEDRESVWLRQPVNGEIWLPLYGLRSQMRELEQIQYSELKADFDRSKSEAMRIFCYMLGNAVYRLVATKYISWMDDADEYKGSLNSYVR